jgi:cyclic pyranopterin monophosphate synthase
MIDISHKYPTLRVATASSIVHCEPSSILAIKEGTVPKGDVVSFAKAATLLAVKNTANILPHCHPAPVEYTLVDIEPINEGRLTIKVTVKAIYRTGVEMEALFGASVAALTIYDMLKPIDDSLYIGETRLLEKTGGKSDFGSLKSDPVKVAVIVCSDSVSNGKKEDRSGKIICSKLLKFNIKTENYIIVPDEADVIQAAVKEHIDNEFDMVLLTGGTGLSPRDVTPEALKPIIDRVSWRVPGHMARNGPPMPCYRAELPE